MHMSTWNYGCFNALMHALVRRRKIKDDGKQIGTEHRNPLINTRAYEDEFIDVTTVSITTNIIYENLLSQVD